MATGYTSPVVRRVGARRVSPVNNTRTKAGNRSGQLPSSWDSRSLGWVTPVRNQNPWGTCWTFAAIATVETQLVKAGLATAGDCDLSEWNIATLHGYSNGVNDGGNDIMSGAHLLRWEGAVPEAACPYASSSPSKPLNPSIHVQNVVWVSAREDVTDNDAIKEAITNYGAVSASFYYSGAYQGDRGAYYYTGDCDPNHAVTVVGWDDDYPASNFKQGKRPPGNGAWLVKNSWGANAGDNGYLHISFYDKTFLREDGAVFIPATAGEDYTTAYGYDRLGPYLWYSDEAVQKYGAVFKSGWNEELAAVGVYVETAPFDYSICICTNVSLDGVGPEDGGCPALRQSGRITRRGFTTIHLEREVPLADRGVFSVVVENTSDPEPVFMLCCAEYGYSTFSPVPGRTFVKSGDAWKDTVASDVIIDDDSGKVFHGNVCLKAYTRTTRTARAGDTPGPTDPGGDMMLDLCNKYDRELFFATSWTFGSFANIIGANGRSLYASWLIGLDPSDRGDTDLRITSFSMTNGVPCIRYEPDLGTNRTYTVYGTENLSNANWSAITGAPPTPAKFFKVGVSQ